MKKIIILIVLMVILANVTNILVSQTSAKVTSNAGAVLIIPITITQTSQLHFGTLNLVTNTAGTCILSTSGIRSFTGGLNGSSSLPLSKNAAYNITGRKGTTYTVTLPAAAISIAIGSSAEIHDIMAVTDFTARFYGAEIDAFTSKIRSNGTDSFRVGAKLISIASQNAGVYSGTFNVSVDYN
jgi:hypothetical protein